MRRDLKAGLLVLASSYCCVAWSQSPGAPAPQPPMKRDVYLVLVKSSMSSACDNPQSPYVCMTKNIEVCRKKLPIALDQCEKKMRTQLPEEIKAEERRQWSNLVARCILDDYILLAGAANIDITRCSSRKPRDTEPR